MVHPLSAMVYWPQAPLVVCCGGCLQASEGFEHQQWVESVAAAVDLSSLRSCLAQLEAALVSSNSNSSGSNGTPGTKKRGKGSAQQQQLLSPDWSRIISAMPAVKGAWLQCGAEIAAAVLNPEGALSPNITGTAAAAAAAAAAAEAGADAADAAAAAATPVLDQLPVQQYQELQQQKAQARASLEWLPATVPALSLRLAALDACVCYPQLRERHGLEAGREIMVRYRYIVKPCPIFEPPALEQLLLQEKQAVDAAKEKKRQQQGMEQQQQTASGSASAVPAASAAEDQEGSPQSERQQQQQEQDTASDKGAEQQPKQNGRQQQQGEAAATADKVKQPTGALDILALVHPTPPPRAKPQPQQQQQQQASRKPPVKPREGVPSVDSVLSQPLRVAYGYSLQGRGLLQLIRGLPPYPDWVSWLFHWSVSCLCMS
jgi:hypothetical protein